MVIIGVGNPLRKDDGIGPKIIEVLRNSRPNPLAPSPKGEGELVELLDGGTDGLTLLDQIAQHDKAIIIDAVDMGEAPGTVKRFTPDDVNIKLNSDALSTHGFGLAEVIKFMQALDIKTDLNIIGVQPKDISFGEGLSESVAKAIPKIIELL